MSAFLDNSPEKPEHTIMTAQQAGWAGLRNGELLKKVSGSYEAFLTIDKRLGHDQKMLADVVVIFTLSMVRSLA